MIDKRIRKRRSGLATKMGAVWSVAENGQGFEQGGKGLSAFMTMCLFWGVDLSERLLSDSETDWSRYPLLKK